MMMMIAKIQKVNPTKVTQKKEKIQKVNLTKVTQKKVNQSKMILYLRKKVILKKKNIKNQKGLKSLKQKLKEMRHLNHQKTQNLYSRKRKIIVPQNPILIYLY